MEGRSDGAGDRPLYCSPRGRAERVEHRKRLGVLLATGLIVGESLYGVLFAGLVGATGSDEPLAIVGEGFASWATVLGVLVFLGLIGWLYRNTRRAAERDA